MRWGPGSSMARMNAPLVALGSAILLLSACAAAPPVSLGQPKATTPQDDRGSLTRRDSGLLVGPLRPEGSIGERTYWLPPGQVVVFTRNEGDDDFEVRRVVSGNDELRTFRIERLSDGSLLGETSIRLDEGVGVVILENLSEDIKSRFAPYAIVAPTTLSAGETVEQAFAVRTTGRPLTSGRGEGTTTLTGVGRQVIETPAGRIDAFVVEYALSFGIGPARIALEQRSWIDPDERGLGLIAEEGTERVRVFGLTVHEAERVSVVERVEARG